MRERDKPKQPDQHWPFDPMQPGDHEPVTIPEDHWPADPEQEAEKAAEEKRRRSGSS